MKLYYNNDLCPRCGELTDHYHGKCCKACHIDRVKEYQKTHATETKAYKKEYHKVYKQSQRNESGKTLSNVRRASQYYLFDKLKHNKLLDYEIHHCFSYDDYTKFIYIPRSLHLKIHQYLKDNNIDAKSNHYMDIVQLMNV